MGAWKTRREGRGGRERRMARWMGESISPKQLEMTLLPLCHFTVGETESWSPDTHVVNPLAGLDPVRQANVPPASSTLSHFTDVEAKAQGPQSPKGPELQGVGHRPSPSSAPLTVPQVDIVPTCSARPPGVATETGPLCTQLGASSLPPQPGLSPGGGGGARICQLSTGASDPGAERPPLPRPPSCGPQGSARESRTPGSHRPLPGRFQGTGEHRGGKNPVSCRETEQAPCRPGLATATSPGETRARSPLRGPPPAHPSPSIPFPGPPLPLLSGCFSHWKCQATCWDLTYLFTACLPLGRACGPPGWGQEVTPTYPKSAHGTCPSGHFTTSNIIRVTAGQGLNRDQRPTHQVTHRDGQGSAGSTSWPRPGVDPVFAASRLGLIHLPPLKPQQRQDCWPISQAGPQGQAPDKVAHGAGHSLGGLTQPRAGKWGLWVTRCARLPPPPPTGASKAKEGQSRGLSAHLTPRWPPLQLRYPRNVHFQGLLPQPPARARLQAEEFL